MATKKSKAKASASTPEKIKARAKALNTVFKRTIAVANQHQKEIAERNADPTLRTNSGNPKRNPPKNVVAMQELTSATRAAVAMAKFKPSDIAKAKDRAREDVTKGVLKKSTGLHNDGGYALNIRKIESQKRRQLSAEIGVAARKATAASGQVVLLLRTDQIKADPKLNLVRMFAPGQSKRADLKAQIAAAGVADNKVGRIYEPVTGYADRFDKYTLQTGFQRFALMCELNASEQNPNRHGLIPFIVEHPITKADLLRRQMAENTKTEWSWIDRAKTAMEFANYYNGATDERPKWTQEQIAAEMGVTQATISHYMSVLKNLSHVEHQQIADDVLSVQAAINLARMKDTSHAETLANATPAVQSNGLDVDVVAPKIDTKAVVAAARQERRQRDDTGTATRGNKVSVGAPKMDADTLLKAIRAESVDRAKNSSVVIDLMAALVRLVGGHGDVEAYVEDVATITEDAIDAAKTKGRTEGRQEKRAGV